MAQLSINPSTNNHRKTGVHWRLQNQYKLEWLSSPQQSKGEQALSLPHTAIASRNCHCTPPGVLSATAQETWVCAVGAAAQQGCRTWFSFCNRITAKQNHNVASCGPKPGRTKVGTAVAPRLACDDCWSTGSLRLLGGPPPRVGPSWARRAASKAPPLTSFVPL